MEEKVEQGLSDRGGLLNCRDVGCTAQDLKPAHRAPQRLSGGKGRGFVLVAGCAFVSCSNYCAGIMPLPLPGPVVSSAALQSAETLSLLDSRQARTSPCPCFLSAQNLLISVLHAVQQGLAGHAPSQT